MSFRNSRGFQPIRTDEIEVGDHCHVYTGPKGKRRLLRTVIREIHGPVIRVSETEQRRDRVIPAMRAEILKAWRPEPKK